MIRERLVTPANAKQEIVDHVGLFLTDEEKENIYDRIMEESRKTNMFYTFFCLDFYYGKLCLKRISDYEKDKATYVRGEYRKDKSLYETTQEIVLMPFNKINIKVGDKIDTREFFSPTKNGSGKYHELKPPIEVVSIYGESVTVAYTFTYRKKSFTRAEVRNKTDIETKLYRKSYTLIQ